MRKLLLLLCAAELCFASCRTGKGLLDDKEAMYSMIYDYDNMPVAGVCVVLDGKPIGESDIQGRFLFPNFGGGVHSVVFEKDGYERKEGVLKFDPSNAVYVKIGTAEQYRKMSFDALESGDYAKSLDLCVKSLDIDPLRDDVLYLKAVLHSLRGERMESDAALDRIRKTTENSKYVDALREKNNAAED